MNKSIEGTADDEEEGVSPDTAIRSGLELLKVLLEIILFPCVSTVLIWTPLRKCKKKKGYARVGLYFTGNSEIIWNKIWNKNLKD